jgi:predicted transcriptional regulator
VTPTSFCDVRDLLAIGLECTGTAGTALGIVMTAYMPNGGTYAPAKWFLRLPWSRFSRMLKAMEVHFTPEQQAQLAQIATKVGTVPERLVKNVVTRYLDEEARFLAAVEKGMRQPSAGSLSKKKKWQKVKG